MRHTPRPLCLLLLALPLAGWAAPSSCTVENVLYDTRDIVCPIPADAPQAVYRLQVNFSGGHDDTQASIVPLLDDAPLACLDGGKTRLMGEDGNVALHCEFRSGPAAGGRLLRVTVKWSHAEYVDYDFSVR